MSSLHKQQGLSLLGVAVLLFLVVFFGLLIVKMSGSYFDHFTLDKMVQTSLQDQTPGRFDEVAFKDRLQKNTDINNITLDLRNDIKVDRRRNPNVVILEYKRQVHIVANVDVIMSFYKEYEL